jgi:hypothetical protein
MANETLKGLNVAILIEDGFEQVEMVEPRKALEQAGAETRIVSPKDKHVRDRLARAVAVARDGDEHHPGARDADQTRRLHVRHQRATVPGDHRARRQERNELVAAAVRRSRRRRRSDAVPDVRSLSERSAQAHHARFGDVDDGAVVGHAVLRFHVRRSRPVDVGERRRRHGAQGPLRISPGPGHSGRVGRFQRHPTHHSRRWARPNPPPG